VHKCLKSVKVSKVKRQLYRLYRLYRLFKNRRIWKSKWYQVELSLSIQSIKKEGAADEPSCFRRAVLMRAFPMILLMILLILPAVYAEEEYTLGVEDVLRISVLEQPELNSTVTVAPDGTIVLPQPIGAIPAKGLTRAQLEEAIRQKLSPHISGGVNVTVQMIEYKSRKIAIFGEVRSPGIYTYVQIPPLPEILARAGGLTPTADLMRIMVLSPDHQKPTQIINLQQLLQHLALPFLRLAPELLIQGRLPPEVR